MDKEEKWLSVTIAEDAKSTLLSLCWKSYGHLFFMLACEDKEEVQQKLHSLMMMLALPCDSTGI